MITYVDSDLFQSPAQVLVNTVNTVGVMGKGIALEFKKIYPEMFSQYQVFCAKGQFDIGQLWLYKTSHKWILNFPTKKHWRQKSQPEYIRLGLQKFAETYDLRGITSISFPLLGCGNGELEWDTEVRPIMEQYLKNLPIDIYIHLYSSNNTQVPEHRDSKKIEEWLRGEPQALAFSEFWYDLMKILKHNSHFETLDEKRDFEVLLDNEDSGLVIKSDSQETLHINESMLIDLWQYIKSVGFCLPQNLPNSLEKHSIYIVSLLSKLDYISPVLASQVENIHKTQIGIQLIPEIGTSVGLFASAPKVAQAV